LSHDSFLEHQHAPIVLQYRRLKERNWTVVLKHIFREENHLADALADKGHSSSWGTHTINCDDSTVRYRE
ncbi:hypothetical protein LINPERPRIM_LOCUS37570, partial [Linum perenne]